MMRRLLLLALAVGLLSGSQPRSLHAAAPEPDSAQAVAHVLNRLSYGARPGEQEQVAAMGMAEWIERQLTPERIDNSALDARLAPLATLRLDSRAIAIDYNRPAVQERRRRQREQSASADKPITPLTDAEAPPASVSDAQRKNRQVMLDLTDAKILRAVYSERQLQEILVDFWFNHFNVFAGKGQTRVYLTEYERDAIRPHVLGSFRDLLGATAKSPAMLFYLDNWLSAAAGDAATRKPMPKRAARPQAPPRQRGINENYARELMELHTLGVAGGYTQQDIGEVARAFTGWTMRPREGTGFAFARSLHDNGSKVVLGQTIAAGGGVEDGERVLDILAAHPSTAHHIATRLVQRFVGDVPPEALVARAAAQFTATHGNLREVVRTIVTSPEFMAPEAYRAKTKTPLEFVASAIRATGADVENAQPVVRALRELGMPPYMCQPPTGYDETAEVWLSAGALVARMNFGLSLGRNLLKGVTLPSADQTMALTIGSPEFQRQ